MKALTGFQKEVMGMAERGEMVEHSYKAVARGLEKKGLLKITETWTEFGWKYRCEIISQPEPEATDGTVIVDVRNESRWGHADKTEIEAVISGRGFKRIKAGGSIGDGQYSAQSYRPSGCYSSGGRGNHTKFTLTYKDWMYIKLTLTNLEGIAVVRG